MVHTLDVPQYKRGDTITHTADVAFDPDCNLFQFTPIICSLIYSQDPHIGFLYLSSDTDAKIKSILKTDGKPNFNVTFYAINKKGDYGCASIYGPKKFAIHDGQNNQILDGVYLYKMETYHKKIQVAIRWRFT